MKAPDTVIPANKDLETLVCPHCGAKFGIEYYVKLIRLAQAETTWRACRSETANEIVEVISDWLRMARVLFYDKYPIHNPDTNLADVYLLVYLKAKFGVK